MDSVIMLFGCFVIGILMRRAKRLPENAHASINGFIIDVAFPALILVQVHSLILDKTLLYAALMPWLLFGISAGLFWAVGRCLRLPPTKVGALVIVGGLGNTSFMGLPMIEAFYGREGIPVGIIISQFGTYLVLSTAGIALISGFAEERTTVGTILRRIATFPPFLALLCALALGPIELPAWAGTVFSRLGATLTPLALVSIGLQFRLDALRGNRGPLALGVGYKLVLGPLLILLLYVGSLGLRGTTLKVTLFEAAMGPMIGSSIVAVEYGLDGPLVSLVVGFGTLASFITLPLWWEWLDVLSLD